MMPPTLVSAEEGKNGLCGPRALLLHARRHHRRVLDPVLRLRPRFPRHRHAERRGERDQDDRVGAAQGQSAAAILRPVAAPPRRPGRAAVRRRARSDRCAPAAAIACARPRR